MKQIYNYFYLFLIVIVSIIFLLIGFYIANQISNSNRDTGLSSSEWSHELASIKFISTEKYLIDFEISTTNDTGTDLELYRFTQNGSLANLYLEISELDLELIETFEDSTLGIEQIMLLGEIFGRRYAIAAPELEVAELYPGVILWENSDGRFDTETPAYFEKIKKDMLVIARFEGLEPNQIAEIFQNII